MSDKKPNDDGRDIFESALDWARNHPQMVGMGLGALAGRSVGRKLGRAKTRRYEVEDYRAGKPTLYDNGPERAGGIAGAMLGVPLGSIAATAVTSKPRKKSP